MSAAGGEPTGPAGGTGAALGEQVLRYSGIHTVGVVVSNVLTFGSLILVANFIDPDEFGQLSLLLFLAGLMTLLFTLASKQGTMKRTFGGDDDDEDDDDEDTDLSASPRRTLGTGLILIGLVSVLGTLVTVALAEPISDALLGESGEHSLVIWAAVAGGTGAIFRISSIAIWIERRPYPYIAVEMARPVMVLAVTVPLMIGGAGLEGAIAGFGAGTALATVFAIFLLRRSWELGFALPEAIAIYRKGAIRVPLVLSMWIVGYADVLILSRFVSDADLGTYMLASRAGFLAAFLPAGYRKALRPLQKTTTFRAVEDEYGVGTARGTQFGYFFLMLVGVLLAVSVFADVLIRVVPGSYADAAPLIPLLAAGLVAPTAYRMLNKSVKYANKRVPFIAGAVVAAVLFIGIAIPLVDRLGVEGAPLAMMVAFLPPAMYIFRRSQRGRTPIKLPYRSMLAAAGLAIPLGVGYQLLDPSGLAGQLLLGLAAVALWTLLVPFVGAIPAYHRAPLVQMARAVLGRRSGDRFEPARGLASLERGERRALRRAILGHKAAPEAVDGLLEVDPDDAARVLVGVLRRVAVEGGTKGLPPGYAALDEGARDQAIGEYLFASGAVAERDQIGKRLIGEGVAEAFDVHTLEATITTLRSTPREVWKDPDGTIDDEEPGKSEPGPPRPVSRSGG